VRWFPTLVIAAVLAVVPSIFAGPACAGDKVSKYDLARRVTEAARMLADHPRLRRLS